MRLEKRRMILRLSRLATVWPELRPEDVDEGLLRFACYVAICHTVYGQSFESLTTEHILGLVSQIRPDMVKETENQWQRQIAA